MAAPLLIHVGYHKTATTWMQQYLFRAENGFIPVAGHAEVHDFITDPHGLLFDPEKMRNEIAAKSENIPNGAVRVISSEILSGNPFFGGHESDVFAERLKQIAPDAKILVSIRSQMRILPSIYMQYILRGGTMPFDQFFAGERSFGYLAFTPEHFEYHRLIAHLQGLFGRENVYVLTQESLTADMEGAARALADAVGNTQFSGLSEDAKTVRAPSYPEYAVPFLRRANHFQKGPMHPNPVIGLGAENRTLYRAVGFAMRRPPLSSILGGRHPVSDYVREQFAGRYDQSNQKLASLVSHPLDLSGYDGIA
ncbi:hypothetical protein [Actibacterium lipolyticum]|uniref:Sulfotransferase domain-containing protein n=1 Tax=Actibacterium lipolyticum TaxID=1524263 RepID=A0A238KUL9_9RHOB|nr:hypothetical protein [Actibacterium lipolyticum]SMX46499.1 hypothetical protein COL8621_03137 [Actibacterium lipolyticum]